MSLQLVMMGLGPFWFGVQNESYQSLSRTASYRWHKSDRIGRAPALQYLGEDAQEITLEGVIYPHYRGGAYQIETMRRYAQEGQPFFMVDILGWTQKT